MQLKHGWDKEAHDISQEQLEEFRSQQKAILKQIRKLIPVEHSKTRMKSLMQQLQQITEKADSAPT